MTELGSERDFRDFVDRAREELRTKRRLTYGEIAGCAGMSPSDLSRLVSHASMGPRGIQPRWVLGLLRVFVEEQCSETPTVEACIRWARCVNVELSEEYIEKLLKAALEAGEPFSTEFERSVIDHRARLAGRLLPSEQGLIRRYLCGVSEKLRLPEEIRLEPSLYSGPLSVPGSTQENFHQVSLLELLDRIRSGECPRVLIYGHVQSGKSMLIRQLALGLSQGSSGDDPIPIVMELQNYKAHQDLLEHAIRLSADWTTDQASQLRDILAKMARNGEGVLLLPGYHTLDVETRRSVDQELRSLRPQRCVVATRGSYPALDGFEWAEFHLGPLELGQVYRYLLNRWRAGTVDLEGVLSLLARDNMAAALVRFPWFLKRLCRYLCGGHDSRSSVSEVLKAFVDEQIGRAGRLHRPPDLQDARQALRELAQQSYGRHRSFGHPIARLFSRQEVLSAFADAGFSEDATRRLLAVCETSGLLHPTRNGEEWFFPVPGLQEYLAAEGVAELSSRGKVDFLVAEYWKCEPVLRFAIPLLLQTQGQGKEALALQILEEIAADRRLAELRWLTVGRCLYALGKETPSAFRDLKTATIEKLLDLQQMTPSVHLAYAATEVLGQLDPEAAIRSEAAILTDPKTDFGRRQRAAWNIVLSQHSEAAEILADLALRLAAEIAGDVALSGGIRGAGTQAGSPSFAFRTRPDEDCGPRSELLESSLLALVSLPSESAIQRCFDMLSSGDRLLLAAVTEALAQASATQLMAAWSTAELVEQAVDVASDRVLVYLSRPDYPGPALAAALSVKLAQAVSRKWWDRTQRLLEAIRVVGAAADIEPIVQAARADDPFANLGAVKALQAIDSYAARRHLAGLVCDRELNGEIRHTAALALKELRASDQVDGVLNVVLDRAEDKKLRRFLAESVLPGIAGPEVVCMLRSALAGEGRTCGAPDELAVAGIIGAMGHTGQPDSLSAVVQFLTDSRPRVAAAAIEAAGRLGPDPELVQELIGVLQSDRETRRRVAAAQALGHTHNPGAIGALIAALNDEETVRYAAIEALGEIGGLQAEEALVNQLCSESSWRSRRFREVALALSTSGGELATRTLLNKLEETEPDSYGWRDLRSFLELVNNPESLNAWVEALDHSSQDIRRVAVEGLMRLGGENAIPILVPLLSDSTMRQVVADTVRQPRFKIESPTTKAWLASQIRTAHSIQLGLLLTLAGRCAVARDATETGAEQAVTETLAEALLAVAECAHHGTEVRVAALQALKGLKPRHLTDRLGSFLRGVRNEMALRQFTAEILAALGTCEAFDALTSLVAPSALKRFAHKELPDLASYVAQYGRDAETEALIESNIATSRFLCFAMEEEEINLPSAAWTRLGVLLLDVQLLWGLRRLPAGRIVLPSGKLASCVEAIEWIETYPPLRRPFGPWAILPYPLPGK